MITTEKTVYGDWGNCIRLSNGTIEVITTLDIGPRIVRYSFIGGENLLHEDPKGEFTATCPTYSEYFDADKWRVYGGHRLWLAPEVMPRSYSPDNNPMEYKEIENGVRVIQPVQKGNNVQLSIDITLNDNDNRVNLKHSIKNCSLWTMEFAPWAITAFTTGGVEYVPQTTEDMGFIPNRTMAFWAFDKFNDSRFELGEKYIKLVSDPEAKTPFKYGINNLCGYATFFAKNNLFVKYFTHQPGIRYPDNGCSYETYTNSAFTELETLGEYKKVLPDETVTHSEQWDLYENVEAPKNEGEMDLIVEKYIKK